MAHTEHGPIVTAALDYIDGWYDGEAARMQRALHPALAKRTQTADSSGQLVVADMGARELTDRTAAGTGTADPARRHDVRVLDVFGRAAAVRVDATGWVDYLHLIQTQPDGRSSTCCGSGASPPIAPPRPRQLPQPGTDSDRGAPGEARDGLPGQDRTGLRVRRGSLPVPGPRWSRMRRRDEPQGGTGRGVRSRVAAGREDGDDVVRLRAGACRLAQLAEVGRNLDELAGVVDLGASRSPAYQLN